MFPRAAVVAPSQDTPRSFEIWRRRDPRLFRAIPSPLMAAEVRGMTLEDVLEDVEMLAACLRSTLEGTIDEWRRKSGCPAPAGSPATTNLCRGAAYGALLVFREHLPQVAWHLAGGWGIEALSMTMPDGTPRPDVEGRIDTFLWPGGMADANGRWQGHFWIEGTIGEDGPRMIVDLTADQFGYGCVVVTGADDPRYRANVMAEAIEREFTNAERAWGWNLLADFAIASGPYGPQGP